MTVFRPGTRLKSQVDSTEVIVVKAPADDLEIRFGGHPAIDAKAEPDASLVPDGEQQAGTLIGKRYVRSAGDLELLVVKGGTVDVRVDGELLVAKENKPLPSSD
jgi:hypothetical protein